MMKKCRIGVVCGMLGIVGCGTAADSGVDPLLVAERVEQGQKKTSSASPNCATVTSVKHTIRPTPQPNEFLAEVSFQLSSQTHVQAWWQEVGETRWGGPLLYTGPYGTDTGKFLMAVLRGGKKYAYRITVYEMTPTPPLYECETREWTFAVDSVW